MRRGEIWWASLPEPKGAEPGDSRPVLIIQADPFTVSRIRTVIVVMITRNLALADAPGNVLLPRKQTRLPRESVANVSQVFTMNKSFLKEKISDLPKALLQKVETGLRLVLSL
jgi:mRNA interferase MazF